MPKLEDEVRLALQHAKVKGTTVRNAKTTRDPEIRSREYAKVVDDLVRLTEQIGDQLIKVAAEVDKLRAAAIDGEDVA
jgi:hypothetical protein